MAKDPTSRVSDQALLTRGPDPSLGGRPGLVGAPQRPPCPPPAATTSTSRGLGPQFPAAPMHRRGAAREHLMIA